MQPYDVIELTVDRPEDGLHAGAVDTIVDEYPDGEFEVEFTDNEGRTTALTAVRPDQIRLRS